MYSADDSKIADAIGFTAGEVEQMVPRCLSEMAKTPFSHYLAYTRPRSFFPCFVCTLTGYALSTERASELTTQALDLLWLFVVYSVLLWGGTNALNSSQDRDEGPVNMLLSPPPLPPYLAAFGLLLMGMGVALAFIKGWIAGLWAISALVLSIYYSVPIRGWGRRGKEIPGIDILINSYGFGLHAVAMGYCATGTTWRSDVWWVGLAISVMCFGGIPTSQIFQLARDDTVKTARNYTSLLGPQLTLRMGAVFFSAHLVLLGWYTIKFHSAALENPWCVILWAAWFLLILAAMVHGLWWAGSPFQHSYTRMLRHMVFVLGAQATWTAAVWIDTAN